MNERRFSDTGSESELSPSAGKRKKGYRKAKKQVKRTLESDSEGNDEEPKVYPTRRAIQTMKLQGSGKKKESSPDYASEDSLILSKPKPRSKKLSKNSKEIKQEVSEDNTNTKSEGSKWKKERETTSDSASDTQTSPVAKRRGPKKTRSS